MNGIKLFVVTNLSNHAMTRYPIIKATTVATKVSVNVKTFGPCFSETACLSS